MGSVQLLCCSSSESGTELLEFLSVYGSDWEKSSQLSASRSHRPALELCSTNACMWMCCARGRYMHTSGCTERKENTENCHFVTSILKYSSPRFLLTCVSAGNIMFPRRNSTFHSCRALRWSFFYYCSVFSFFCKQKIVYLLRTSNTSMLEYIIQII